VKASATAAFSQSTSVEAANELTRSGSNSVAVSSVNCNIAKVSWIDALDDKFGLKFLHPDFEAELNGTAMKIVKRFLLTHC
jgi:hypothetical protein